MNSIDLSSQLKAIDALLVQYQWLWRPQPFKHVRPEWCVRLPELTTRLLALSDDELALLTAQESELMALLAEYLPELAAFEALCQLPARHLTTLTPLSPHLNWAVPGRKWTQIEAFAQAVGPVTSPVLEWCGGKGHLGRLLAMQWQQPALTLEYDPVLCRDGTLLAQRARVAQQFHVVDVLLPAVPQYLIDRHTVALHACGALHRTLVRQAVAARVPAFDIAPCCYHLGSDAAYQPFFLTESLALVSDDLRLAVTETVTSSAREVSKRDREMAWKLGFDRLRRDISGEDHYRSIRPIDKQWLTFDFAGFCQALAQREQLAIAGEIEWPHYEQFGWQRQREVMRLSLVRHAVRRPLELWLVLDMANYIIRQGYRVELGTFCPRQVTPRNLLLSARLAG